MTRYTSRFLGLLFLGGVSLLSKPAMAGTSFEFLFSASNVSDDNQLFLNLSVGNYGYPRTVVEPCLPRLRYVETDLPVVLFLARSSGRPVDFIVDLRSQGLSWGVIFSKCNVHYDVLFAGISRDPGPPYGKAWGHWKKNKRAARLSDDDIVGLVHCQVAHRVSGVSVYDVAHARGQGKSVAVMVADKKGRPEHIAKSKGGGKSGGDQDGNAQAKRGKQGKGKK